MSRRKENETRVSEFLLLGITNDPGQKQVLFWLFLCMYLITVAGNVLIILVICSVPHLHSPMYFFLTNLSFVDICFTTNLIPKLLVNHVSRTWTISYPYCLTQMYFLISFAHMDTFLLAVMALDHYVVICNPLQYLIINIITPQLCGGLAILVWTCSSLISLVHTLFMSRLTFCSSAQEISHFYCDAYLLMKIACSDTRVNQHVFLAAVVLCVGPCVLIMVSYICTAVAVLQIPSAPGRRKAFSTCCSYLSVVNLFYGTVLRIYVRPDSFLAQDTATIMYTVVIPMLNPFIYSLRNKDMKEAMKRLFSRGSKFS
ncbi:LOW QUALITY PROTEIN: olfactory receptor 1D2-like [Trichechus inunguis]